MDAHTGKRHPKLKIFFKDAPSGQALVESVFCFMIVLLVIFGCIEIFRLMAFKSALQSSAFYAAQTIALHQLEFSDPQSPNYISHFASQKKIRLETDLPLIRTIADGVQQDVMMIGSSVLSFDSHVGQSDNGLLFLEKPAITPLVRVVPPGHTSRANGKALPAGVYLSLQACLPVLFAGYFNTFHAGETQSHSISIGQQTGGSVDAGVFGGSTGNSRQNCMGQFTAGSGAHMPQWWFFIRTAAYSPWPASGQIFSKGFGDSEKINGIDDTTRAQFFSAFSSHLLTPWLK